MNSNYKQKNKFHFYTKDQFINFGKESILNIKVINFYLKYQEIK